MKRWAAVVVMVGIVIGTALAAPAANAGTAPSAARLQPTIAASDRTMCAIRESYRVYCWGSNSNGELGRGNASPSTTVAPVNISLIDATAIYGATVNAGSGGTFCALRMDRTVWCWGDGNNFRLGNGSTTDQLLPTQLPGLTNVASMSLGDQVACAVKQDGTVWCLGAANDILQGPASLVPKKITGLASITSVAVGSDHACALKIDRSVWCWGWNDLGRLGDGTTTTPTAPVKVTGLSDATAIATGTAHTCALRAGGTVVCWGDAAAGQLGHLPIPAGGYSKVPVSVTDLTGVTGISSGPATVCATTASALKCWGMASAYNLGDTQGSSQAAPVLATVGLQKPTQAALGGQTTCEIANGGRVWCFGFNGSGEAGNQTTTPVQYGDGPGDTFGIALTGRAVAITNSAPGKPTGTSTVARKIKISWSAPSTSNGTSAPKDYVIYYQLKGSTTWKKFTDSVTTTRSATVTGLTTGKYYRFMVVPVNWAGAGTSSAVSAYIKSR